MLALRPSRRQTALIVLVLSLGTLGFLWFGGESDEQAVARSLHELADVVRSREGESLVFRSARLNGAFKDRLDASVTLDAPELSRLSGIRALVEAGAGAPRLYGDFEVELEDLEIDVPRDARSARATGRVTLTGIGEGEARRETRSVTFRLAKSHGEWLVNGIEVAGRDD
jgi:hypothetical protein